MKKSRFAVLCAALAAVVAASLPSYAQEEGQWRLDTVVPLGKDPKLPSNAIPGEDVRGWWWLPIGNVNSLIQQMNDEYDLLAYFPEAALPDGDVPNLWAFPAVRSGVAIPPLQADTTGSAGGLPLPAMAARSGMAVIETANAVAVIGAGTSAEALALKSWIQATIGKPIRYGIIADVNNAYWINWYTPGQPLTIIQSRALLDAASARLAVGSSQYNPPSSTGTRFINVEGAYLPADTDWRLNSSSSGKVFGACTPPFPPGVNCVVIESAEQTLTLDGVDFHFINVLDEIGGLVTYLPAMQALIPPSLFGGYLPNTAALQWPVIPVRKVTAALALMKKLDISYYFPLEGFPLTGVLADGRSTGAAYLHATWVVLRAIHDETAYRLLQGMSLDEIVTAATIPAWAQEQCLEDFLPMSPCGEFENSLASMVKGIYTEYMGWFDGTARSLSSHVTSADKASLFLEVADDVDGLVTVAAKMTAAADDLASIERALYLVEPLHELGLGPEVDVMYFQLLWKAGMLQTANDLRNYYLTLAWQHKPY